MEEVTRAYLTKHTSAVLDEKDEAVHARLWPDLAPSVIPPSRPVDIVPELLATAEIPTAQEESVKLTEDEDLGENKNALIVWLAAP